MNEQTFPQQRLPASAGRHTVRTQFAAMCFRRKDGETEVLLVTSRNTKRWVLPKGWPMPQKSPSEAARVEAWEEAGVKGRISPACLGIYSYVKTSDDRCDADTPCIVAVFPLNVTELADDFPEKGQRERKWLPLKKAAQKVVEPELSQMIATFKPELYFG